MNIGLNPIQAINATGHMLLRLSLIVMWLVFAVFHLSIATCLLILFWSLQWTPHPLIEWATSLLQSAFATNVSLVVGFAGLSALGLLVAYVKAWQRIYGAFVSSFVTKGL